MPTGPYSILEAAQHDDDKVKVISLSRALLEKVRPRKVELNNLTHVRRRLSYLGEKDGLVHNPDQDATGFSRHLNELLESIHLEVPQPFEPRLLTHLQPDTNAWIIRDPESREEFEIWESIEEGLTKYLFFHVAHETAIVIGNRLPKPGQRNVVHLVSFENCLNSSNDNFRLPDDPNEPVTLISLKQWSFFCESEEKTFTKIAHSLNNNQQTPPTFQLPVPEEAAGKTAGNFLNAGLVPLRHFFREGSRSISLYHGPLMPRTPNNVFLNAKLEGLSNTLSIRHADELMLYDPRHGVFDVSYAAAWELGRMLTLHNQPLALRLYHWKRRHARSLRSARHLLDYGYHLPVTSPPDHKADPDSEDAALIWKWLNELSLLQHIPFNYLVPDPALLPPESLRFFTLDQEWIKCLRDGAFSAGRVIATDTFWDKMLSDSWNQENDAGVVSGFILRSELVSAWPDMHINAYTKAVEMKVPTDPNAPEPVDTTWEDAFPAPIENYEKITKVLRRERLSRNVLLCLFPGEVQTVDFFRKPETVHFGFQIPINGGAASDPTSLTKKMRNASGIEIGSPIPMNENFWRGGSSTRVAKIKSASDADQNTLFKKLMGDETSAGHFATQMIGGSEFVRLTRKLKTTP